MNFNNMVFEFSIFEKNQLKKSNCYEIVFSGRSNVGKSSLINKLANRKSLARVSAKPGKTGTINFFSVNNEVKFVDLPGYGYAKVSKNEKIRWADLVETYFTSNRNISLVVQLLDSRHPPTAYDIDMIKFLVNHKINFVVALTKSDKLSKTQLKELLFNLKNEFPLKNVEFIAVSNVSGEGIDELKLAIEKSIG